MIHPESFIEKVAIALLKGSIGDAIGDTIELDGNILTDLISGNIVVRRIKYAGLTQLRKIEFRSMNHDYVLIEQNPNTTSEWAGYARAGHQVVQVKDSVSNRYLGVVVDGKFTAY
jgi:hypothetical protein